MRIKSKTVVCLLWTFLLVSCFAVAQDMDVEGSKDHPLISRYPGSAISHYNAKEFEEYLFPLGKLKEDKLSKSQKLEGKITRITYQIPEGRSTLEVYRNYELALKKGGFVTLFTGAGEDLGGNWQEVVYPEEPYYYLGGEPRHQRCLSAKLSRPEGDIYASIYVSLGWYSYAIIQLDVIEVKPMETGLVTVNADALATDITNTGHVAIYGIYFDTGKADVKPESEATLKEIVKLLQHTPKLNLYVVGHTDNVGTLTSNMELSKQRAESVVKMLVSRYATDSKKLQSVGVGPLSPVASNKTEEGRAKNRRVELVEQ